MPTDVILKYTDYRNEPVRVLRQSGLGYSDWIKSQYKVFRGVDAPDVPDPRTDTVMAFVNAGRWLWQCFGCDNAFPVEPGEPSICAACGDDWVDVILPDDREQIEAELLQQPGHRFYAPVREWRPGQTVDDLRVRTVKAAALIAAGATNRIRALSIGATRLWSVGEILTAANKNTFESEVLKDLAGRNGRIDLEDAIRVKDGTDHTVQPYLDLTQDYVGLPQRGGDPGAGNGRMAYRTDTNRVRINENGTYRNIPRLPVPVSEGGTGATTVTDARTGLKFIFLTEAEYQALTTPDPEAVYLTRL